MTEKLLIFDCDGTLVDSEGIANEVFIGQVKKFGVPITEEEAWEHFPGTSLALCMDYVEKTYGFNFPEDFVPKYREIQIGVFAERLEPIPGIVDSLQKLPHSKCVASNGPVEIITRNLKTTGLDQFFHDRIYSAYQIQKWKPLPDLFHHAAGSLGYRAEDCIVIEDSDAGIQGALNAGMKVLAYQSAHMHYTADLDGAIGFNDMSKLPELIREISN